MLGAGWWRGLAWEGLARARGSPGSCDTRTKSLEAALFRAFGRRSGARDTEGGPVRSSSRRVGRKGFERCQQKGEREVVGREEREERRKRWKEKEREREKKEKKMAQVFGCGSGLKFRFYTLNRKRKISFFLR